MSGTNETEHGLNADVTEDELFNQIQNTMKTGTEFDLNKLMDESTVETPESLPVVPVVQIGATEEAAPVPVVVPPVSLQEADWLAALPEEAIAKFHALKAERDKFEHKVKSDEGRVPSLQRQVEELKRKTMAQRPAFQAADVQAASSRSTDDLTARIASIREVDPMLADTLESFRNELAAPIREEFAARTDRIEHELRQKEDDHIRNRENEKLINAVPAAHDVFRHPEYQEWKASQTEGVMALANSAYADDVLVAFDKFAKDMRVRYPQADVAVVPAVVAPIIKDAKASTVISERDRKLKASAPASVGGIAKAGEAVPEDEDGYFDWVTKQIQLKQM